MSTTLSVRELAIVRLLETHDLNLPEASRQSSVTAGFVHKERSRTCPDCLANDRISPTCETCFGRGHVDPRYAKNLAATDALDDDEDRRDPYSVNDKPNRYGLDGARHDATYARDREIATMARQTRPPRKEAELLVEANAEPYSWERARDQMRKRFDYDALDAALEDLRQHDHLSYRALHAVFVYRWLAPTAAKIVEPNAVLVAIGGSAEQACRRGLRFLSPRLAAVELSRRKQLRSPGADPTATVRGPMRAEAGESAKALRATQMMARAMAGATPEEIAREFEVSISTVYRVVNRAA